MREQALNKLVTFGQREQYDNRALCLISVRDWCSTGCNQNKEWQDESRHKLDFYGHFNYGTQVVCCEDFTWEKIINFSFSFQNWRITNFYFSFRLEVPRLASNLFSKLVPSFGAVQKSLKSDLVKRQWQWQWQRHWKTSPIGDPMNLSPFRHLIRVMRRQWKFWNLEQLITLSLFVQRSQWL